MGEKVKKRKQINQIKIHRRKVGMKKELSFFL